MDVMSALITPAISTLLQLGREKWVGTSELKTLRKVLRERLAREMRYNVELNKIPEFTDEQKINAFDMRVMNDVFSQPLPLQDLFPTKLDKEMIEDFAPSIFNRANKIRMANDQIEADLIERLWHRHSIAKLKLSNELNAGDTKYLRGLVVVLEANLRTVS